MMKDASKLRRPPLHGSAEGAAELANGTALRNTQSLRRMQDKTDRTSLVLWWRPFVTIYYFFRECSTLFHIYMQKLFRHWKSFVVFLLIVSLGIAAYNLEGTHQKAVQSLEKQVLWCSYWIGLGILSSVGLGTGLHTFVLYLGPHIAKVTLAAYECMSVNFPEPPYPSSITCPEGGEETISLWTIMSKVRLEAMMWGVGTAIGELPPYFMARAARLSGDDDNLDDDEREELEELTIIEQKEQNPEELSQLGFVERLKVYVHALVHKAGFFGILACASIPNPLFDLAGITCGHFLIPFWTFFGATLIGKAVIKMHIQKLFVIFAFSQHHADQLVSLIKRIPSVGASLQQPFKDLLLSQRAKLHKGDGETGATDAGGTPWLSWMFEKVVTLMVVYFVISIVNSFAQSYHKRLCKLKYEKEKASNSNSTGHSGSSYTSSITSRASSFKQS